MNFLILDFGDDWDTTTSDAFITFGQTL